MNLFEAVHRFPQSRPMASGRKLAARFARRQLQHQEHGPHPQG